MGLQSGRSSLFGRAIGCNLFLLSAVICAFGWVAFAQKSLAVELLRVRDSRGCNQSAYQGSGESGGSNACPWIDADASQPAKSASSGVVGPVKSAASVRSATPVKLVMPVRSPKSFRLSKAPATKSLMPKRSGVRSASSPAPVSSVATSGKSGGLVRSPKVATVVPNAQPAGARVVHSRPYEAEQVVVDTGRWDDRVGRRKVKKALKSSFFDEEDQLHRFDNTSPDSSDSVRRGVSAGSKFAPSRPVPNTDDGNGNVKILNAPVYSPRKKGADDVYSSERVRKGRIHLADDASNRCDDDSEEGGSSDCPNSVA